MAHEETYQQAQDVFAVLTSVAIEAIGDEMVALSTTVQSALYIVGQYVHENPDDSISEVLQSLRTLSASMFCSMGNRNQVGVNLRRLEERGLIVKTGQRKGKVFYNVTPEGEEVLTETRSRLFSEEVLPTVTTLFATAVAHGLESARRSAGRRGLY